MGEFESNYLTKRTALKEVLEAKVTFFKSVDFKADWSLSQKTSLFTNFHFKEIGI